MQRPLIGVLPLIDREKESYWMLPGYMRGVEAGGGLPVMLPLTADGEQLRQLAAEADGFLFTGGQDVAPELYHAPRSAHCGELCPERDEMEATLFRLALRLDKPILGICRGIQAINVFTGGDLYQDLPSERPSAVTHRQAPPYDRPVHGVRVLPETPLGKLLQKEELAVNSCHHQAVRTLSPRLRPMAYSTDGLVEAAFLPEARFVWAVQWHPECSCRTDGDSQKIFRAFVAACRGKSSFPSEK